MRILRGLLLLAVIGCGHTQRTHVDGGVLGRVVIYRNGVAFYERTATVHDGRVTVRVPRDRVDDFLKSLTVVDPATRKPLSVTIPRQEADDGSYLTMTLETPERRQATVLLTYVTEAPAWKPSYRVVVGASGKVMLEGWAIVDNTTSEDWKGVLVGVGASSALAFRYDLWSVRTIDRDLLASEEKFAIAPPTGVSPYSQSGGEELASIDPAELRGGEAYVVDGINTSGSSSVQNVYTVDGVWKDPGKIAGAVTDKKSGEKLAGVTVTLTSQKNNVVATMITDDNGLYFFDNLPTGDYQITYYYAELTVERKLKVAANKVTAAYQKLDLRKSGGEVVKIYDSAPTIDPTSTTQGITIDKNYHKTVPVPGRTFGAALGATAGSSSGFSSQTGSSSRSGSGGGGSSYEPPKAPDLVKQGDEKLKAIAQRVVKDKRDVVIEVHSSSEEKAQKRGTAVKNKLVNDGVMASRIHIAPKVGPSEP
ncbi:MAG: carboxypeptidase regulatory-like domain-containing protein, partial [Deltaproteobacteria bacterium]|nr:carboxypeptidase regulatory-like domain-containing protein [Deltaproteobacteria bacterium]